MGIKTLIRQLISKWGIMSIEMQKAFESDSFDTENVVPEFVDNGKAVESDPFIDAPAKLEDMVTDKDGKLVDPKTGKAI
jgi:recombination protein RecT